ncbi:hypothetical protein C8J57DRAFT_1462499 [Mycena rebaudengoi]|nr:hypothetical protein C8J57DRAFT_1462499 [Mycena rebaudengoi]
MKASASAATKLLGTGTPTASAFQVHLRKLNQRRNHLIIWNSMKCERWKAGGDGSGMSKREQWSRDFNRYDEIPDSDVLARLDQWKHGVEQLLRELRTHVQDEQTT